jgi:hypothetical protein
MHIDTEFRKLLKEQDGVVGRWQTRDPATLARMERRLTAQKWQAPYIGVYVNHNGPLTAAQRRWAALLACGAGAVLTGQTVLEHDGIAGLTPAPPHVAVPYPKHGFDGREIRTTRVRQLGRFVHPAATPPQVRLEYAALVAASRAKTAEQAHAILTAVVQQNRLTVRHLQAQLDQLPKLPQRRLIAESLLDMADGAQSLNEIALLRLVRRGGFPEPRLQVHVASARRRAYIDGGWPAYGVWFEVDGELHREAATWADDLDRANELAIEQGGTRLRWSGFAVRRQPGRVADQATRALSAGGWSPGA